MRHFIIGLLVGSVVLALGAQDVANVAIYDRSFPECSASEKLQYTASTKGWSCVADVTSAAEPAPAPGASLPSGFVGLVVSGSCPQGTTQITALDGKTLVGTVAANANVGGTGGADSITPAGTNANGAVSAHAGAAVADHASHTHTYTDVPNHVHPYASQTATTGAASSYEHGAIDASSAATEASITTNNPTGGVATGTTAGPSSTLAHVVTQPSNHTFTQPTFSGTQFDNRSAFTRVIFCAID